MTKYPCKYCGFQPKSWIGAMKANLQGHGCPATDVFKLAETNGKAR